MKYLFLLLFPTSLFAASLSWYDSTETGVVGQPCWINNPVDNSTYIGSGCASTDTVDANILTNAINPIISAGVYKTWVKVYVIHSAGDAYITVNGGGAPTTGTGYNDSTGVWKYVGLVDVPADTNKVVLTFGRTSGSFNAWPITLYGMYMNTDTNVTLVNSTQSVQTWIVPTTTNTSAIMLGNILPNGSFEVPSSGRTSVGIGGARHWSIADAFVQEDPYHGKTCMKLEFDECSNQYYPSSASQFIYSKVVRCRPNRAHTFSIYARSKAGGLGGATFKVQLFNAVPYPTGETFPAQPTYASATFPITSTWQQFSYTAPSLWEYPYCEYYARVQILSPNNDEVYLDAMQLEEGSAATPYQNPPFEVGIEIPKIGNILYQGETNLIKSILINTSTTNTTGTVINWRLYHRGYNQLTNGSYSVNTVNGNYYTNTLPLPQPLPLGFYRLVSEMAGFERIASEYDFTVIRDPLLSGGQNNFIGTHTYHYHHQLQVLERVGIKHYRSLSPGAFFRFSYVKPTATSFITFDSEVNQLQQYVEILGNLQQEYSAAWAMRTYLTMTNTAGTFQPGETVSTTGASGVVTWVWNPAEDPLPQSLQVSNRIGNFLAGNVITGLVSGATALLANYIDAGGTNMAACQIGSQFPIDQWRPYCSNIVAHYTNVHRWEVLNEPSSGQPQINNNGGMNVSAILTREGVRGIRDVRTTDKICIVGGLQGPQYANILWDGLPNDVKTNVHAASFHLYCNTLDGRGTECAQWAAARGLEYWNTETGWEDGISQLTVSDNRHYNGFALRPHLDAEPDHRKLISTPRMIATNIIETGWAGAATNGGYYYYDWRHSANTAEDVAFKSGSHYSMVNIHDTLKAKTPSLIFLNYITYKPLGLIKSNNITGARVFAQEGKTNSIWLAFYSPKSQTVSGHWGYGMADYETYDLEGNNIPVTDNDGFITFGAAPTFVRTIGKSWLQVQSEVDGMSFAVVGDGVPPRVLIKSCPTGLVTPRENEAGFVITWNGFDQISAFGIQITTAMSFRHRFNAEPWSEWSNTTTLPPQSFAPGTYTLYVEGRDEAMLSSSDSRTFTIP